MNIGAVDLNEYEKNKPSHDAAVVDLIIGIPKNTPEDFDQVSAELNKFEGIKILFDEAAIANSNLDSIRLDEIIAKIKAIRINPKYPKIQSLITYILDVVDPNLLDDVGKLNPDPYCFAFCDTAKKQFLNMCFSRIWKEAIRLKKQNISERLSSLERTNTEQELSQENKVVLTRSAGPENRLSKEQLHEIDELNKLITKENQALEDNNPFVLDAFRVSLIPGKQEILLCLKIRKIIRLVHQINELEDVELYLYKNNCDFTSHLEKIKELAKNLDLVLPADLNKEEYSNTIGNFIQSIMYPAVIGRQIEPLLSGIGLSCTYSEVNDYSEYLQRVFVIFNLSLITLNQFTVQYTAEMRKYMTLEIDNVDAPIFYLCDTELSYIYISIRLMLHNIKNIKEFKDSLSVADKEEFERLILDDFAKLQARISPIENSKVTSIEEVNNELLSYKSVITNLLAPNNISFDSVKDMNWTGLKMLAEVYSGKNLPLDLELLIQHPIDIQILVVKKVDILNLICARLKLKFDDMLDLPSDVLGVILNFSKVCDRLKTLQEIELDIKPFLKSATTKTLPIILEKPEALITARKHNLSVSQIKSLFSNLETEINQALHDFDTTHRVDHLHRLVTVVTDDFAHELKNSGMHFYQFHILHEQTLELLHWFVRSFIQTYTFKVYTPETIENPVNNEISLWFDAVAYNFIEKFFTKLHTHLEKRLPQTSYPIPAKFEKFAHLIELVRNPVEFADKNINTLELEENAAEVLSNNIQSTFDELSLQNLSLEHLQLFHALLVSGIFESNPKFSPEPWRVCAASWSDRIDDGLDLRDYGLFDFAMLFPEGRGKPGNITAIHINNFFQHMRLISNRINNLHKKDPIDKYSPDGEDALFQAIANDDLDEVKKCIKNGMSPIGVSHKGISYLAFAYVYKHHQIISYLKEEIILFTDAKLKLFIQQHKYKPISQATNKPPITPLFNSQNLFTLQFATNNEGYTVFQKAVKEQRRDICSALLALGQDPFSKGTKHLSPFELAKASNQISILVEFWNHDRYQESLNNELDAQMLLDQSGKVVSLSM